MKKWWKAFPSGRWSHLLSVGAAAAGLGYGAGILRTHSNEPHSNFNGKRNGHDELRNTIFPSSLFAHVSAAIKVQDSLLVQHEDVVPEPSSNSPRIAQIMRYGFPSLANVRSLDDFVLSYDSRLRIPQWVFEHLTPLSVSKNDSVDRSKCDFHEDGSLHHFFRATNQDYKYSGYDRGHMAAAGNHRTSQEHCRQTFVLSNMAPQVGKGFNRDKWNELEQYCRKLVRQSKNVYVCTGPLFLPKKLEDGNLYVHYRVLGENHVAVPTHFFKVVVCESESGELTLESFLMPNAVIDDKVPLSTFYVPAEVVERASGLLLFDRVNKKKFKLVNGKSTGWI